MPRGAGRSPADARSGIFSSNRRLSRYENLKFRFLPFVVASIVARVFFSAVFAARAPAMGNSADRAWQLSQLVEGVSTAFNPSHGSLFRRGRRARRARFPTCGGIRVAGYSVVWEVVPISEFFQRAPKGALRPFSVAALLHYVLWCASEYSVVGRISCYVSHDNIGINVCQRSFAEFFLAAADSESNRFYPCFRESRDVVSADIPVC